MPEFLVPCPFHLRHALFPRKGGGRVMRRCHVSNLIHRCVQLILAYSWARPAILVVGKGECFYFFCFFTFIFVPLSSLSLSFFSTVSFLAFSGRQHKMTHKGWSVIKPQHSQLSQQLSILLVNLGMVGIGEGVVYLKLLGRPTDIGLQLGKVCYPCIRSG